MTHPDDYAFPTTKEQHDFGLTGLTKREYFAACALQGLLTGNDEQAEVYAVASVRYADALILELSKEAK